MASWKRGLGRSRGSSNYRPAVTTGGEDGNSSSGAINQSGMARSQGEMFRKLESQDSVGTGARTNHTGTYRNH